MHGMMITINNYRFLLTKKTVSYIVELVFGIGSYITLYDLY